MAPDGNTLPVGPAPSVATPAPIPAANSSDAPDERARTTRLPAIRDGANEERFASGARRFALGSMRIGRDALGSLATMALSIGCVILAWHLATAYRIDFFIRFTNVPTPLEVWDRAVHVVTSAEYLSHIGHSLGRIGLGFLLATLLAVPLGFALGYWPTARRFVLPAVEMFRPIPAIAWVPLSVMLWPTNEVSMCFITFLGAFFPILLNSVHGVLLVDPLLVRAARSLGASRLALFHDLLLPAALPHVFVGLALGMGVAWISLIAAEMISGQFGIGYFTWEAYSLLQYADIVLGMITIGLLGLACSGLVRMLGTLLMPWLAHAGGRR